ncbi:uncharacterized protein LOC110411652 [Herrania umbratica]|uniref:Uncharacterized protein LOC110411652 n=1 Tax=Herrania umbratica TaxID=108875 RepID=A0A6J0ZS68_9ROSI|nr:uncharacterized protein LOC110411652 [Herrania umbratica]
MIQSNSNSSANNPKPPDTYQPMLTESVQRFLSEYRNGATDFSNFTSIFSRLLQTLPDPPLEFVWFYSAVTFHSTKFDSPNSISASKDLFQLLVSCSASCKPVTRISVLAPVIYELFRLAFDRKELKKEVESLLEGIVSYISICCGMEAEGNDDLSSRFVDLLRVWMVDRGREEEGEKRDYLKVFFPIASEEVRKMIGGGCRVWYLAGVVMCQAFLLRLCLKFGAEISKLELEKDVHDCAVQMITGFRNFYFLDILFRMLLEPVLPITSLLGHGNEILLREILYDAVITMDHTFLCPQGGILLPGKQLKDLALTWSFVADNAIWSVRENGNQTKAISYINAFSESCLPSQLINWVTSQTGMGDKARSLNVSTPVALIKWLLIIEDQGVRIFECDISKVYAKAVLCKSRAEYEIPVVKTNGKILGQNFVYMVHEGREAKKADGDLEMIDSMDTVPLTAPCLMKSTPTDGVRKRKEGSNVEEEIPVKFVKYHFHENLVREKLLSLAKDDGLSSGSEVDNPASDEDMKDVEQ